MIKFHACLILELFDILSDYPLSETTNKLSLKPVLSSFVEFTMSI